ncbi:MAG TPA: dihydropteroate synthase [Acidimicrobiia bacterium]|nr:dihydropteroate synthase [Acidimicrobiia bacterium]
MSTASSWSVTGGRLELAKGVLIGVLNVTPDSFSDGGELVDPAAAVERGMEMTEQGAALIDVGGESTRPGAEAVDSDEELRRTMPAVEGLVDVGVRVSIDTSKPDVARAALSAGAVVVNDVTGFRDEAMIEVAAGSDCGVVVMHMKGTPRDMHHDPAYDDVVSEVESFLIERAGLLERAGVSRDRIVIDPGLGFGKRAAHSVEMLGHLGRLAEHGLPVMIGASRKGFLSAITGDGTLAGRDQATSVVTALGFARGARLFRVHDVAGSRNALSLAGAIVANQEWDAWLQG